MATAVNLLLLCKLHVNRNIRTDWKNNYFEAWHLQDAGIFILLLILCFTFFNVIIRYILPKCRQKLSMHEFQMENEDAWNTRHEFVILFALTGCVWLFFFLVFYPGTAMNDTIYVLSDPWKLSRQHPILFNLYIYAFYRLGCKLGNPNIGLALISLIQMCALDFLLVKNILWIKNTFKISKWVCKLCAGYFALAPIYFTYAFTAVKDVPYSIFLLGMTLLIAEAMYDTALLKSDRYIVKLVICMTGVTAFRNNGILVSIGVLIVLGLYKGIECKKLMIQSIIGIVCTLGVSMMLTSNIPEGYFQEKAGVQIQQLAATLNKTDDIEQKDKEYLYRILPREQWELYAPSCSDILKWNKEFDREYLNETRWQFMKIWFQYLPGHLKIYSEAYLLNTYGFWGIETRNPEQYYVKDIYSNQLGLEQKSILPNSIHTILYKVYCNRYTYGYMSGGTLFWIVLLTFIYAKCMRVGKAELALVPALLNSMSVLVCTPIAFCFRYIFILALIVPFLIIVMLCKEE